MDAVTSTTPESEGGIPPWVYGVGAGVLAVGVGVITTAGVLISKKKAQQRAKEHALNLGVQREVLSPRDILDMSPRHEDLK